MKTKKAVLMGRRAKLNIKFSKPARPERPEMLQKFKKRNGALGVANHTGYVGEKKVAEVFKSLKHIGEPGADFAFKRPDGKVLFFEVKTSFGEWKSKGGALRNHILLKTRGREWVNNKTHYVIFVTKGGLFMGKASDLRAFVKMNHAALPRPKVNGNFILAQKEKGIDLVLVSIKELLRRDIVFTIDQHNADARLREYMGLEKQKAGEQDRIREELARKAGH
ncbi:MAG: hypothetical protein Q7R70_04525 [Candidatus Diapherotrites archaeon]|nr:hypothetical protein [Candidatus Diapherotrites archaeon]